MSGLLWAILIIILVAEIAAASFESLVGFLAATTAALVAVTVLSDVSLFAPIVDHPLLTLLCVPVYFGAGALWAFWKWGDVIVESLSQFETEKASANRQENGPWTHLNMSFEEWARKFGGYPPQASKNKERIVTWIVAWPFSVMWAALQWPHRMAVEIYNRLAGLFQEMADRAFADKFQTLRESHPNSLENKGI